MLINGSFTTRDAGAPSSHVEFHQHVQETGARQVLRRANTKGLQSRFANRLFLEQLIESYGSLLFQHGAELRVRPITLGELGPVRLAQRTHKGVAAFFADFAVVVPHAAVQTRRAMFFAHGTSIPS